MSSAKSVTSFLHTIVSIESTSSWRGFCGATSGWLDTTDLLINYKYKITCLYVKQPMEVDSAAFGLIG